jgi:hypothetical protein
MADAHRIIQNPRDSPRKTNHPVGRGCISKTGAVYKMMQSKFNAKAERSKAANKCNPCAFALFEPLR